MLRQLATALFAVGSIPVCAAAAVAAAWGCDRLLGEAVPSSYGKRGLVDGLLVMWGVVLFGFLLGQAERVAGAIAGDGGAVHSRAAPAPRSRSPRP